MKYYFESKNSEICYPEQHFQELMKAQGLNYLEVFEADKDKLTGYFFCRLEREVGVQDGATCGKFCEGYEPRNGKSGCCKHYSNIGYEPGKPVILRYKFSKDERIIWNSSYGYEIGYFVKDKGVSYETYLVDLATGIVTGEVSHSKSEIFPYSLDLIEELTELYGYEKKFSEIF